jgi:hypothetical protein
MHETTTRDNYSYAYRMMAALAVVAGLPIPSGAVAVRPAPT